MENKIKELEEKLLRKEQECEHWKHQAELGVDTTNRLTKELEEKEQECEKLKESLKVWKYSDVQHIFKINKYEQTLTEIKQLLEDALDTDKTNAEQSFDNIHKAIKLCEVLDDR